MADEFWNVFLENVKRLRSPMRPDSSEIEAMSETVLRHLAARRFDGDVQLLVLGLTAALVEREWPARINMTVIERSETMVAGFWNAAAGTRKRLLTGDWWKTQFPPGSFHFVLGDGVFNLQDYPLGFRAMAKRISELLTPDGLAVIRVFIQMDEKESPEQLVSQYDAGEIRDFQQLRFRLGLALQPSAEEGIRVNPPMFDRELAARGVDLDELYSRAENVTVRQDKAFDDPRYLIKVAYPTQGEFEMAIAPHLAVAEVRNGTHPLAHCCPIYCLAVTRP